MLFIRIYVRALQIMRIGKRKWYYNCISISNIWYYIVCAERGGRFYLYPFHRYTIWCNQYILKYFKNWYHKSVIFYIRAFMIYTFTHFTRFPCINVYHLSLISWHLSNQLPHNHKQVAIFSLRYSVSRQHDAVPFSNCQMFNAIKTRSF